MGTVVVEGVPIWMYLLLRVIEGGLVIFFTVIWLVTMQRALDQCIYAQRKIEPTQVWLVFIPLFGLVWQFIAVIRLSETLANEYRVRGWNTDEERPAIETGIIVCIVVLIALILRLAVIDLHPGIAFVSSLGICLCMFMHRDRVKAFTERLETENRKTQQGFGFGNVPNTFQPAQFPPAYNFPPQPFPQQQYQQAQFPPAYNFPPQQYPQYQQPPPQIPLQPNPYAPPNPYQPPPNNEQPENLPPPPEWSEANRWRPPQQ